MHNNIQMVSQATAQIMKLLFISMVLNVIFHLKKIIIVGGRSGSKTTTCAIIFLAGCPDDFLLFIFCIPIALKSILKFSFHIKSGCHL